MKPKLISKQNLYYRSWKKILSTVRNNPWLASTLLHRLRQVRQQLTEYVKDVWLWLAWHHPRQAIKWVKRVARPVLVGGGLVLMLNVGLVQAGEITVTHTGDVIANGDGCGLREAIINANNDNQSGSTDCATGSGTDTITLLNGTITLTQTGTGEDLALTGDLDVLTGTQVIIQGQGMDNSIVDANRLDRVFHVHPGGSLTLLKTTITGGEVTGQPGGAGILNDKGNLILTDSKVFTNNVIAGPGFELGGGIYSRAFTGTAAVTITNSIISSNATAKDGGGVATYTNVGSTNVTISNSTITGNSAGDDGGGFYKYTEGSTSKDYVTISNSTISGNTAGDDGGGIETGTRYGATYFTVNNSTITGNSAGEDGGGVDTYANHGTAHFTVNNSTISGNSASDDGGGIYNHADEISAIANLTINNSTISGNSAGDDAGGLTNYADRGTANLTINNSTISGNSASEDGGGLDNEADEATGKALTIINNSTISGNSATENGGGIYNDTNGVNAQAFITMTHTTLVNNTADAAGTNSGDGGGIFNRVTIGIAQVIAKNSLIGANIDNTPVISGNVHHDGTGELTGNAYNLVSQTGGINGSLGSGTDIVNTTLNIEPLANNGGTATASGEPPHTHALANGSPALNVIPSGSCLLSTDQRGISRPQAGSCDIGAFEKEGSDLYLPIVVKN